MHAAVRAFQVQKDGSTWEEYEDACAVAPGCLGEVTSGWLTAAVADGASEALLAGRWARQLVVQFTDAGPHTGLAATVAAAMLGWDDVESEYRQTRQEQGNPIAWYEEDGLHRGSYATIVGVRLLDGDSLGEGSLMAWSLGDSCLFHVRDDTLITAFPLDDPAGFGTNPALAPSRPTDPTKIGAHIRQIETTWRCGDSLYLASDALACWFLTEADRGRKPWQTLSAMETPEGVADFGTWIEQCRVDKAMRNDDTTLLSIDLL